MGRVVIGMDPHLSEFLVTIKIDMTLGSVEL
jgi:hypothetical protein